VAFEPELLARIGAVLDEHSDLIHDHRAAHPWVTAFLGDPHAPV
jgi:hypothetical protein